jgi:hypothetical protein
MAYRFNYVALALLTAARIRAQEVTGSTRGSVTDPSGARVQHAVVSAVKVEMGIARQAVSDSEGNYLLVLLPVGRYRLEVAATGFQKYVQNGIMLSVNEVAVVPVQLAVGSQQQTAMVEVDAALIETTNDLGETVHEREILDLPLNGRNFSQLGLLQPGVAPLTQGLRDAGGPLRANQAYSVNGLRPESNQFLIDGVENYDEVYAGFALEPPIDAITEFRILTKTASAEFGHSAGSTTNIVTRSGSNQLYGNVCDFLRNDDFDARNLFAQHVEPLKQNQFGATIGGPIRREKTFFFGYYDGFRNRQGQTYTSTVPSILERQGDFSQTIDPSSGKVLPLINELTGDPYPDNKLPSINSTSQNLLAYYPLPNTGTNLFTTTQTVSDTCDQFGVRIDHYLSTRDRIFGRYDLSNGSGFDPIAVSGAIVPGFPVQENDRTQNAVIEERRSFSPTLVNIARVSFLRRKFLDVQGLNHTDPSTAALTFLPACRLRMVYPMSVSRATETSATR